MRIRPWLAALAAASILGGCTTLNDAEVGETTAPSAPPPPASAPPPPPPPPLPPPPMVSASPAMSAAVGDALGGMGETSEIVVTGARIDGGLMEVPGPEPKPDRPQPEAQAGMLTAGDYDDVLNPDLYKAYVDRSLQGELAQKALPYVDANNRIVIRVVDRLGKPVPLARVSLRTADGEPMFPLRTGANGLAYIYPAYDALEAGMIVTAAADGAQPVSQKLSEDDLADGGELTFDLGRDAAKVEQLDLLLTLDATGSMTDEMRYLQVELVAILDRLKGAHPDLDVRAGFIVYRDHGDEYVVKSVPFSGDLEAFKAQLAQQVANGGGDFPEAMQDAMKAGLNFTWRDDAVKVNVLVADAPPHDGDIAATWDSALIARSRGIHVVPLAASGVDDTAEFLMRSMSQLTAGRYMFLTDDSGIGNPHAEPTVDCYVVTRLDGLVLRVLDSLVSGVRVEPDGGEVIRTVGNYRAGICKVDAAPVS